MPNRHCLPCSVKYMKLRSKNVLQYFEMSERPLATHPKNEMLECIISLCKNYWYSVFEALTCHSSDNSNGSNRCCSTLFFMLLMLMLLCPVPAVAMRAVNTLPLLSFPLYSPISLLAALSSWWVLTLVVVVDGIKVYVNVNTDVVANWICNQLLSNYYWFYSVLKFSRIF